MRISEAIDGYWLYTERNLSPSTVADYSLTFRRLVAYLDLHNVTDIEHVTPDHINGFLNDLAAKGLARKTQLNAWVALSALWTWAENTLDIPHIIRQRVRMPHVQRNQPDPYTADDVRAFLAAVDYTAPWNGRYAGSRTRRPTALRDRAIILLLLDTGLRASELCALRIDDYDRKSGRMLVRHGKGDKARVVFAGQVARQAVWRYLQDRLRRQGDPARTAPLFATNTGQALDRGQLLHMIRGCAQRAGIKNANVHRFRHTFAITALRNGANALVVQEMLGHVDMKTMRLYVKLAEVDLERAMRSASPADSWHL